MITSYSVLESDIQRRIALDVSENLGHIFKRAIPLNYIVLALANSDVDIVLEEDDFTIVKNDKLFHAANLVLATV